MIGLNRTVSILASSRLARRFFGVSLSITSTFASKVGWDPVVEILLRPLGTDARITFHLLNRDLANLIEVFVNRVYDKYCTLGSGDLVIDCGAYVGEFTIHAAKNVGEEGLVLAFEPNHSSFCFCKANIDRNRMNNVKLFEHALGDTDGLEYLQVNRANLGATRIIQEETHDSACVVSVKMLSEFLPYFEGRSIKLLKIDVEGSAVQVARGATNLFDRKLIQNVSAEIHPGEEGLRSLLESYGFRCSQEKSYLYAKL